MPRVNSVKKCRKTPGKCSRCAHKIKKGEPYIWWKFNFGAKYVRCAEPSCYPKPSDLTRSEFWGRMGDLQQEGFEGTTYEELRDRRETVMDALNEIADDCEEKFNNMPQSLQDGDTGQLLQERADACRDCVTELEDIDLPEEEPPDEKDEEAVEEYDNRVTDKKDLLDQALNNISCS